MAPLPTAYIINLDGSDNRWLSAMAEVEKLQLSHIRVPAVDGRNRPLADFADYNSAKTQRTYNRDLNGGEIGCYLSHLRALTMFIASVDAACVIFEDDFLATAQADAETLRVLGATIALLDEGWEICNLGSSYFKRNRVISVLDQRMILQAHMFPTLTHAIFWSRAAALDFVAQHREIAKPVDHAFRAWATRRGRALMVGPPLFGQIPGNSDINISATSRADGQGSRLADRVRRRKIRLYVKGPLYVWAVYHRLRAMVSGLRHKRLV